MELECSLQFNADQSCVLKLTGELDQISIQHDYWPSLTADKLSSVIKSGKLTVDLSALERADTAGLAWLINLVKHARVDKVQVCFDEVPVKLLNLADLSSARDILTQ